MCPGREDRNIYMSVYTSAYIYIYIGASRECRGTLHTYRDQTEKKRRAEEGGKRASSRPQGVVPHRRDGPSVRKACTASSPA